MPYRRSYGRRTPKRVSRSGRRRGTRYTTMGSVKYLAKKAYQGVRYIRSMINCEKHKADTAYGPLGISTTAAVSSLNQISQGDNEFNRQGNSVLWKYMTFSGALSWNATGTGQALRIVVVMDTQQISDTAPAGTDLWETTGPFSLINNETVGRFSILYDKVYVQKEDCDLIPLKFTVKKSHHLRFNGTASTDPQKGGMWLLIVSNQAVNTPTVAGTYRVCFYDN